MGLLPGNTIVARLVLALVLAPALGSTPATPPEEPEDSGFEGRVELPPPPTTARPVPSEEDRAAAAGWLDGGTWRDQHEAINELAREGPIDVVFLGDSITQSWGGRGRHVSVVAQSPDGESTRSLWTEAFGDLNPGNFGISGDRTQHVLWRIDHGHFDAIDPRAVVLLIGTNNLPHDSAHDIAWGIGAIIIRLEAVAPRAKLIVLGILPRGEDPEDPLRRRGVEVNRLLQPLDGIRRRTVIDIGSKFLLPDGRANPDLLAGDFVHLKPAGYRVLAETLRPLLEKDDEPDRK